MQDLGVSILLDGHNLIRLLEGLWITMRIALLSMAISMALGILLDMVMTLKSPITKALSHVYLEMMHIMPQLVLLFLVHFGVAKAFEIRLSGEVSAIIMFVFWGTAEVGDLVRDALISVPKRQYEGGRVLGLTGVRIYRYITIPQTIWRLLPLAVSLTTRMVKATSSIVLTGVVKVLRVGQQIIEANRCTTPSAALWIYGAIFFPYFLVCFLISRLAGRLEERWQD